MGTDAVLHLQALVLNLQKEIMFAENVAILSRGVARGVILFLHQEFSYRALQAPGESDQTRRMFRQESLADSRLVVEAV